MKFFLFLITLQLSLISIFTPSNVALAVNHEKNPPSSNQRTLYLNEEQFQELIKSISGTKQESINIETTKGKPFIIKIKADEKSPLAKGWSIGWSIFSSLIPVIVGAGIGYWITQRQDEFEAQKKLDANELENNKQRIANTLELIKQWDDESMRTARNDAWNIPRGQNLNEQEFQTFSDQNDENKNAARKMLRIVDFFDRLTNIKDQKFLDLQLAKALFSKDYQAWDDQYFQHQDDDWQNNRSNRWNWLIN